MKRWLKATAVRVAGRLTRQFVGDPSVRAVVLCYHSVHPHKTFASLTPELFERHLEWLGSSCDVRPLREAFCSVRRNHGNNKLPVVALTFDDGYADNYEYAFPLLNKYQIPATFFLTAGFIEKDRRVLERFRMLRQSDSEDTRPLEWSQIREMTSAGIQFGAHTYSHPNLGRLSRAAACVELRCSREIIEDRLGRPIRLMAYPFGKPTRHFTAETMALAAETGYEYAAAVLYRGIRPADPKLGVPRFVIARDDLGTLRDKVYGSWDVMGWWQENAPMWAARMISPEDFADQPGTKASTSGERPGQLPCGPVESAD